jgi:hypothetical protein
MSSSLGASSGDSSGDSGAGLFDSGRDGRVTSGPERRSSARTPFPARVVVAWRDGGGACETHAVVDMSLGGFRLHSDHDVPVGRAGRAVQLLPERTAVDLDVLVVWSVRKPSGGCEFGVRFVKD